MFSPLAGGGATMVTRRPSASIALAVAASRSARKSASSARDPSRVASLARGAKILAEGARQHDVGDLRLSREVAQHRVVEGHAALGEGIVELAAELADAEQRAAGTACRLDERTAGIGGLDPVDEMHGEGIAPHHQRRRRTAAALRLRFIGDALVAGGRQAGVGRKPPFDRRQRRVAQRQSQRRLVVRDLLDAEPDRQQRQARRCQRRDQPSGRDARAVAERRLDKAPRQRRQNERQPDQPRHGQREPRGCDAAGRRRTPAGATDRRCS